MSDRSETILEHTVNSYETECTEFFDTEKISIPANAKKTYIKKIIHSDDIDIHYELTQIDNSGGYLVYMKSSTTPTLSNRGIEKLALSAFLNGGNTASIETTHTTKMDGEIINEFVTKSQNIITF